jgi:hypothetical protein
MAVGAIVMFFAAMLFGAPSASAITIGNYYCGSNNTPTTGATYHRSGNNPSWYFNLTRCGSFKQTSDSNGKFFSTLMTQTFASFTIGLMNVPDAIQPTVFFERMEYADKYGLLCTATPTSPIAMGQYDKMNFGINATTGDISTAYFVHAGDTEPILMRSSCISGNHWTSRVYIGTNAVHDGWNPYLQWVFEDGPPDNDVFSGHHFTYKLTI